MTVGPGTAIRTYFFFIPPIIDRMVLMVWPFDKPKKCNACGSTKIRKIDTEEFTNYKCENCGNQEKVPKDIKSASGAKQATQGPRKIDWKETPADYGNLMAWLKAIAVTAVLGYFLSVSQLINGAANILTNIINMAFPNNTISDTSTVGLIWSFVGLGLLGLFWYTVRYDAIWPGIMLILLVTLTTIVAPMAANSPYFSTAWCEMTNLNNIASCSAAVNNVPPATKVGPTGMANVYFDTSSYGMTVFGDSNNNLMLDLYTMPIMVSNPSDTKIVKNFYIVPIGTSGSKTGLYNSSMTMKTKDKQKLDDLIPDKCDVANKCTLQPGEQVHINLKGTQVVTDDVSTGAEVQLTYAYDYNGEGQNDFIFASNYTDLQEAKATTGGAIKFEGPVDVTLIFSPDSIATTTVYSSNISMQLYLSKDGDVNHADITSPISVTMLYPGSNPFAGTKVCAASWGDAVTVSSTDTQASSSETDLMTCNGADTCPITLSTKQLLSCTYPYQIDAAYVNYPKVVKFVARLNYTYYATLVKKGIFIQRITPVPTTIAAA